MPASNNSPKRLKELLEQARKLREQTKRLIRESATLQKQIEAKRKRNAKRNDE